MVCRMCLSRRTGNSAAYTTLYVNQFLNEGWLPAPYLCRPMAPTTQRNVYDLGSDDKRFCRYRLYLSLVKCMGTILCDQSSRTQTDHSSFDLVKTTAVRCLVSVQHTAVSRYACNPTSEFLVWSGIKPV